MRTRGLWCVVLGFLLLLWPVNPLREMAKDDDWTDGFFSPHQATDREWSKADRIGCRWFDLTTRYGFVYRRK
jgi:hypothetical protein